MQDKIYGFGLVPNHAGAAAMSATQAEHLKRWEAPIEPRASKAGVTSGPRATNRSLPYAGLRVVEFTHMVMGPTCGMVLADLGAEVIKVEPIQGRQRKLLGSGAGFCAVQPQQEEHCAGPEQARGRGRPRLIATADVVSENFKPGTMEKAGSDYPSLRQLNPRLIYVSHQGFCPARTSTARRSTKSVQMMGGLAYDRPPWRPAARRHQRERHHGRHVWRHGRDGRAGQREKTGQAARKVQSRCSRTTCSWWPAHDAVCGDRPGRRPDAQPHFGLGHLRRVHRE